MKKESFLNFQYNRHYLRWFWFVIETVVSAFVGALIAFVFGGNLWAALVAFGILMAFLVILCFILILFENKVSVLSIMNQGLSDGKYEDVIKFGSAMSPTLFTSNKNEDRVILGRKIDEAATKIQNDHYNKSKGDYLVTIDGHDKTINLIRTGLKIDDLGWSLHLCENDDEAVINILLGIRDARNEAVRLKRKYVDNSNDGKCAILPYVKLIMRGYRHLSGIYYEDITKYQHAIFYENVTRIIMSNYSIITFGGVCENKKENACGLYCSKPNEDKAECIRRNIKTIYFDNTNSSISNDNLQSMIADFLDLDNNNQMSLLHIQQDVELFNYLRPDLKEGIIKEQCYAWGRNMVKRLQRRLQQSNDYAFISDAELACKIYEAKSFAQLYYYGTNDIPKNDGADLIIDKNLIGKSELRYLSLLNEISMIEIFISTKESELNIDRIINNLRRTADLCRDKRADLYVRNLLYLMRAHYLDYNWCNRYVFDNPHILPQKKKEILQNKIKEIRHIYKSIIKYEHRRDEEVYSVYQEAQNNLICCGKEIKIKYEKVNCDEDDFIFKAFHNISSGVFNEHTNLQLLKNRTHLFDSVEIQRIKDKWAI